MTEGQEENKNIQDLKILLSIASECEMLGNNSDKWCACMHTEELESWKRKKQTLNKLRDKPYPYLGRLKLLRY